MIYMNKKDRKIIKEDIKDLSMLIDRYLANKKFEKASECLKELRELENKLK